MRCYYFRLSRNFWVEIYQSTRNVQPRRTLHSMLFSFPLVNNLGHFNLTSLIQVKRIF